MSVRRSVLLIAVALSACGGPTDPGGQPPLLTKLPRSLSPGEEAAIAANNTFAFKLLGRATTTPGQNAFLSPLSVSMAIGMVMNGAKGPTRDSIAATLGFGALPQPEINEGYRGLIDLLQHLDDQVKFTIANSIWTEQRFPIKPAFLTDATQFFDAEARSLDFSLPASVTTINEWVKAKTSGKIPTILDQIASNEILFAINAIYFKGLWRDQFKPAQTTSAPFHQADGATATVPMMHRLEETPYFQGPDFQAADLWYGAGAHTMTVILPTGSATADELAQRLTAADFAAMVAGFHTAEVDLFLPRFRLEYQRSLKEDLTTLGMGIAFSDRADLTGIADAGLTITRVIHKTYIDVDEEGTEAAAVTAVGVGVTSAPVAVTFRVDRPFLVVIRERLSGTILFLGRVSRIPS